MKNIFVGNLDVTTTESQVRNLFQTHGEVATVTVVIDRDTGSPRGFAFVEMVDDNEADAAIKALNGTSLEGRCLVLNEAREKLHLETNDVDDRRKHDRDTLDRRSHRQHRY